MTLWDLLNPVERLAICAAFACVSVPWLLQGWRR